MRTSTDTLERENERLRAELAEARGQLRRLGAGGGDADPNVATMEAVGRFAGGVAHDFNNFLIIAAGNAELLARELDESDGRRRYVSEISRATDRCRAMVRRLLSFSRKRSASATLVDINARLEALHPMFQTVVGDAIHIETALDRRLPEVRIEPSELEQLMMNLVVNARDAMPEGGDLLIETDRVLTSHDRPGSPKGTYVRVRVTDTGAGISPEMRSKIFEPFFSTRGRGGGAGGSGLGLATVYGIARQHGGDVTVSSKPGRGSTFEVRLPVAVELAAVDDDGEEATLEEEPSHLGTILYVEDEPQVRSLTSTQLERGGFRVLSAKDAQEAQVIAAEHGHEIDVLVTDIMMPGIDGIELAVGMVERRPDLPVLFVSGYASATLPEEGPLADARFLPKPFTLRELLGTVQPMVESVRRRKRDVRAALG